MHNYSVSVAWSQDDEEFVATSPEFPHLSGMGATRDEAVGSLEEAMSVVLEAWAAQGQAPPQPRHLANYSGQFRLRLPKSLHAALAMRAEEEGVSLNALAQSYVAAGLGGQAAVTNLTPQLEALAEQCGALVRQGPLSRMGAQQRKVFVGASRPGHGPSAPGRSFEQIGWSVHRNQLSRLLSGAREDLRDHQDWDTPLGTTRTCFPMQRLSGSALSEATSFGEEVELFQEKRNG